MPKTILLTGATGFIGFRTLVQALRAGYHVRIAVRGPPNVTKIQNAPSIQPYLASISFTKIADMTSPGAYDEAIQGCDYVIHVASPIPMKSNTQQATEEVGTEKHSEG